MEKLSSDAKLVLRLGHKFAIHPDIRKSLHQIITSVSDSVISKINRLPQIDQHNFRKWKINNVKYLTQLKYRPPLIERKIKYGINDLKNINCVIKQADKNMGITAIRGDIYNGHTRKWLQEPAFIKTVTFPHDDIVRRLGNIVSTHNNLKCIGEKWITHALQHTDPNPFYSIPKIHKQNFGTRPITATHSYCLSRPSMALADYLQLEVNKHDCIAQDSRMVVRQLEKLVIKEPCVILTYDIESCYPNMNIRHAIETITSHLVHNREQSGWMKLLQLINYNNFVTYAGEIYRQMQGTATGTQVAPPFCNLYLYYLFKNILDDSAILFNSRYIDDGLVICKTRDDAHRIAHLINNVSNLNITYDISYTSGIYLDLIIYKGSRFNKSGIFDLTTYFKPTNKLLYLPFSSCHPTHMKTGVTKGEAIRLLRNNCHKAKWIQQCTFVFKGLMARGYPPSMIKKSWAKIRFEDRDKYIWENSVREKPQGMLIVTTYHPLTRIFWKSMKIQFPFPKIFIPNNKHEYSKKQTELLRKWPPTIVYGQFTKIGTKLISAKQSWSYPTIQNNT